MIATPASASLNAPDSPDWTPANLRLLRDGDAAVRERFFDEYLEKVHSLVARRVANPHQVQDLVQEVFLKLHRSLGSYDPERALGPWVTTIAMNTLRDHWRASARRELPAELTPELDPGLDDSSSPSAALERQEFHEGLQSAIGRLSELSRTVLVSRAFDGEAFEDISRKVGRSEVAVRKRYSRAVASLRSMLTSPALS
jgi:RNA polymerase sigma-70 factor (ECF subfamily)